MREGRKMKDDANLAVASGEQSPGAKVVALMDERTLSALKGSIDKWRGIEAGELEDNGIDNCPLCGLFYDGWCEGCPVSERTGLTVCEGSPYMQWADATYDDDIARADTPKLKALARAEREFLESLLPRATTDVSVSPHDNVTAK